LRQFVISIDELVYEALVPDRFRNIWNSVAPLPLPARRYWKGLCAKDALRVVWFVAFTFFVVVYKLVPSVDKMVQARDALCAGDLDFVYTVDGGGGISWAYPDTANVSNVRPRNFPNGTAPTMEYFAVTTPSTSYASALVDVLLRQHGRDVFLANCSDAICFLPPEEGQVVGFERPGRPDCCFARKMKVPNVVGGRFSLSAKSGSGVLEAIDAWNPTCVDALDTPTPYVNLLHGMVADVMNVASCSGLKCPPERPFCRDGQCVIPTCATVAEHCPRNSVSGLRARQLCPVTCGCTDPTSSLTMMLPEAGCGRKCLASGLYQAQLNQMPCQDMQRNDSRFVAFLDDFESVAQSLPADHLLSAQSFIGALRTLGCDYFSEPALAWTNTGVPSFPLGINLCVENGIYYPTRPLSYFCPVSCGCKPGMKHCPSSCSASNATNSEHTCPDAHREFIANPMPFGTGFCPIGNPP
jgi:hypothetical protein